MMFISDSPACAAPLRSYFQFGDLVAVQIRLFAGMFSLISILAVAPLNAHANQVTVSLDTTSLSGSVAQFAFDLIDGDGLINNSVTISDFSSNGVLGTGSFSGGVTGSLPGAVTVSDADFFNELLQGVTLGSHTSFKLAFTNNFAGGPAPDGFSFFLLDSAGANTLVTTSLLGDALVAVDYSGAGPITVVLAASTAPSVPIALVPEPSTSLLLVAAGIALALLGQFRSLGDPLGGRPRLLKIPDRIGAAQPRIRDTGSAQAAQRRRTVEAR